VFAPWRARAALAANDPDALWRQPSTLIYALALQPNFPSSLSWSTGGPRAHQVANMSSADGEPLRDRALAAYGQNENGLLRHTRRRVEPLVIRGKRARARLAPVLRPSALADALQTSLLKRIDVSGYNAEGPPSLALIRSQVVSAAQILEPDYAVWTAAIGETPRFHRKQWEHVVALAAASQGGQLKPGMTAIGFGVGTEPLPAALASFGVRVVATDRPEDEFGHWSTRGEYSSSLDALVKPEICDPEVMRDLVSFRPIDMNAFPDDLEQFDFVWSSCAFEHLGSPEAGLDFVRRSLDLLRPGGLAVHTTEFDLTPGMESVDYGHCAVYRLDDLESLASEVRDAGFEMSINPYVAFEHPADRFIAPPLSIGDEDYHLKLALYESITTSIALVIRRTAE